MPAGGVLMMNVIMLFTIYCRNCNHANTWNIEKSPKGVNLAPGVGYSVCCETCGTANQYHLTEITVNQTKR